MESLRGSSPSSLAFPFLVLFSFTPTAAWFVPRDLQHGSVGRFPGVKKMPLDFVNYFEEAHCNNNDM